MQSCDRFGTGCRYTSPSSHLDHLEGLPGACSISYSPLDNVLARSFFALVYLRTGRNLWVAVVAHGVANTVTSVLLYFGLKVQ